MSSVELLTHMGDDMMVANVARVSYGKQVEEFSDKDARLLRYLVKHKHTSPFRHPQLQFRVKCPIYVERQLFKHQVGMSANSISGRYVDFSDEYEVPEILRLQSESSKQGSGEALEAGLNSHLTEDIKNHVAASANLYEDLVGSGVAKEQARVILPLCLVTQFVWTGSFLSFIHLFNLRIKPDAQQETREVAEMMLQEVRNIEGNPFAVSLKEFGYE